MPPLGARHRGDVGEHIGPQRQIAIVGKAPVIFARKLQPVDLRDAHIGHQKAAFGLAVGADRKTRQRQDACAKQFQHGAFKADAGFALVIDHAPRGDAPAGVGGAAFRIDHRAGGIGGIDQDRIAIRPALG